MSSALIVLGHGSRNPIASEQFLELVAQLRARRDDPVYPAFMELAEPSLTQAVSAGAERIIVQPCFLFDGMHIQRDIPAMLAGFKDDHPGVSFYYGRPFGVDVRLVELMQERAREATCLS